MVKVIIENDGEQVQVMEGEVAWGAVNHGDGNMTFVVGKSNPAMLALRIAESIANLTLEIFDAERGGVVASLVKSLVVNAVETAFEEEPDEVNRIEDVVIPLKGDE